jgi:glucokinase
VILAGDIGGTKTVLALLARQSDGTLLNLKEETYASQDFLVFDDILTAFLPADIVITSVCFGVAGPVVNQRCQTTNLPWLLDAQALKTTLGVAKVKLLNDLEAMALGMLHLPEGDLVELNPHAQTQNGNKAVIAAGTGLGEAILYWDGKQYYSMATEGGHSDFAAQNATQDLLLAYLRKIYPEHVSYERILSGIGFSHLYDFFCGQGFTPTCKDLPEGVG